MTFTDKSCVSGKRRLKICPSFLARENVAVASADNGNVLKDIAYEIINAKETM